MGVIVPQLGAYVQVSVQPSADTSGATDIAAINAVLALGGLCQLKPGALYYVNQSLKFVVDNTELNIPAGTEIRYTAAVAGITLGNGTGGTGGNAAGGTATGSRIKHLAISGLGTLNGNGIATIGIVSAFCKDVTFGDMVKVTGFTGNALELCNYTAGTRGGDFGFRGQLKIQNCGGYGIYGHGDNNDIDLWAWIENCGQNARKDTGCGVTSGSTTVTDTAIVAGDQGKRVSGPGIPSLTYVGTVTAGTSFLLSSSPTSQVNVNATATATTTICVGSAGGVLFDQDNWSGSSGVHVRGPIQNNSGHAFEFYAGTTAWSVDVQYAELGTAAATESGNPTAELSNWRFVYLGAGAQVGDGEIRVGNCSTQSGTATYAVEGATAPKALTLSGAWPIGVGSGFATGIYTGSTPTVGWWGPNFAQGVAQDPPAGWFGAGANTWVVGALNLSGHIVSGGTAPTYAAGANAGTGASAVGAGNDVAGTITVTGGTSSAAGQQANVQFRTAYPAGFPRAIVVTPLNANAAALTGQYVEIAAGGGQFYIHGSALSSNQTYQWAYACVG